MKIKELKEQLAGQYDSIEVFIPISTQNVGNYHTDFVGECIEDYSEDSIVASYRIMDREDYDTTILANSSMSVSDIAQPDRVLVIQLENVLGYR